MLKQIGELGLHGNPGVSADPQQDAKTVQTVHVCAKRCVEIYLKEKLDSENGDAFVEAATRFNRRREVGCVRVGNI